MPKIGAVILAAGESSRLGRSKQLIQFRGRSLVQRVVDAAGSGGCQPILVVTGSATSNAARDLEQTTAVLVQNRNWKRGIGSSIQTGVRWLTEHSPEIEAVVLLVCDQPFANSLMIKRLISRRQQSHKPIVASRYADTLGVPALFDRGFFAELLGLGADCGAKSIILRNREKVAEISFPQGNIDIDTADDLEHALAKPSTRA
jgi:molybdenum cofactor cytidylyltransferase